MTDLKKLLGDSPLLENERRRLAEQEALLGGSSTSAVSAIMGSREALSKTVAGRVMESVQHSAGSLSEQIRLRAMGLAPTPMTAIEKMAEATMDRQKRQDALALASPHQSPMEKAIEKTKATDLTQISNLLDVAGQSHAELAASLAGNMLAASLKASKEQMRQDIFGRTYTAKTASEHFEEMARNAPLSSSSALARLKNDGLLASVYDRRSFEEFERERKEKQFAESSALIATQHHQMERHAAAVRKREDEKLEYARRSAEASEKALEAERQRTAAAINDAAEAKEDARWSRRNMRISLWITGVSLLIAIASLLVAAWPFINGRA